MCNISIEHFWCVSDGHHKWNFFNLNVLNFHYWLKYILNVNFTYRAQSTTSTFDHAKDDLHTDLASTRDCTHRILPTVLLLDLFFILDGN